MPEMVKTCVKNAADALNSIPVDKREMAARLAETYAAGLAVGMGLAEAERENENEEE